MSTEMHSCPSCGGQVPVSALLCPQCGRPNISTSFASGPSSEGSLFGPSSSLFSAPAPAEQPGSTGVKPEEPSITPMPEVTPHLDAQQPAEMSSAAAPDAGSAVNVVAPRPYEENTAFSPAVERPESGRFEAPSDDQVDPPQLFAPGPPPQRPITMASGESTRILPYPNYPGQQEANVGQGAPAAQQGWQQAAQITARHAKPAAPPSTRYEPYAPTAYTFRTRRRSRVSGGYSGLATTAFLLELLGYLGLLGLGHIYAGWRVRGVVLLVGWWVYTIVAVLLLFGSRGGSGGLACCLYLLYPFVPIASGVWVRAEVLMEAARNNARGDNLT